MNLFMHLLAAFLNVFPQGPAATKPLFLFLKVQYCLLVLATPNIKTFPACLAAFLRQLFT